MLNALLNIKKLQFKIRRRIFNTIKKLTAKSESDIFNKLVTILSILFNVFLSQLILNKWKNSTLASWNNNGIPPLCHHCESNNVIEFQHRMINDGFGIFDKNMITLSLYYGTWIPKYFWNRNPDLRTTYLNRSFGVLKDILDIQYLRCQDCVLIMQNYPHDSVFLEQYYGVFYRRIGGEVFGRAEIPEAIHLKWKSLVASYFIDVSNLSLHSKILDVGCAEGCFLLAMNKHDMQSYGIDPAEPMINYARDILGLDNVKSSVYSRSCYEPNFFDAINCFHVFEHILELEPTLQTMHYHLKIGGGLLISVPCVDLAENVEDLNLILAHDHIYVFSEKWFQKNLPKFGFEVLQSKKTSFNLDDYGDNYPGREFDVAPHGDVRGGISIFARKT